MLTHTTSATPWLFVLMTTLTLLATVAIGAMVAAPSWIMLGFALAAVFAGCGAILAVIARELAEYAD